MSIIKDISQTVKNIFNGDDDMMFDDESEFELEKQNPLLRKTTEKKSNQFNKNQVMNFNLNNHGFDLAKSNQNKTQRSNGKIQIYVPKTFDEAFNIIKDVKNGFTAMVNVEVANAQVSQRIIDVVSGAIYALDGDCKKMGEKQYIFSLSTETIGAYDYLPTNGGQNMQMQPQGFNFNLGQNYDMAQGMQHPNSFPMQNFGNINQNNYNQNAFNQNAERISQDMQNFYVPPKSQF